MAASRLLVRAVRRQWAGRGGAHAPASLLSAQSPPLTQSSEWEQGSQWQPQQRQRSDFLSQRAINALKSKRNVNNADSTPPSDASEVKSAKAPGDEVAEKPKPVWWTSEAKEEETVATVASASDGTARPETIDPVPATAPEASPTPDSSSNNDRPAIANAPDNAQDVNPTPDVPNDANADDSDVNPTPDVPNDTNANDSNPWTHMHLHEFAPKIVVVGVGGAGTNAVNNMVASGLAGVEFLALNTDAQHLSTSLSPTRLQIGTHLTSGLGCGANPDAGRLAAEESSDAIQSCIEDAHMVFITAGMGGGTGTGAAPVVAGLCYDLGILTVSVVTTPFRFEGTHRRRLALEGVDRLKQVSDTLIVVPNQNLFRLVGEKTSFVDSFRLADNVLLAGVRSITDLMTSPGLINLDFADVQSVMHGMGNALLGTGQACHDDQIGSYGIGEAKSDALSSTGDDDQSTENGIGDECRAIRAAKMALNNPLLGEGNMDIGSAKGMLVNMTGGSDMTLHEVDRAAEFITERVLDPDANIIFGSAYDVNLTGCVRVSVVATGIDEENE